MTGAAARSAAYAAVLAGAGVLLAWAGPPDAPQALAAGHPVDAQIARLAAVVAWACLLWLMAGALAALAAQLPGALGVVAGRICRRITPALVRRAVEAAVGAAVLTSSIGAATVPPLARAFATVSTARSQQPRDAGIGERPAGPAAREAPPVDDFDRPTAAPTPGPGTPAPTLTSTRDHPPAPTVADEHRSRAGTDTARLSPSQFVAKRQPAVAAPLPVLAGPPGRTSDEIDEVVVHRGDTLWGIAARHVGADATAAQIDAEWRRWYAANRASVGPDPDLIRPGLRLIPPQ
jgi:nucleoid-associated protein YgaU